MVAEWNRAAFALSAAHHKYVHKTCGAGQGSTYPWHQTRAHATTLGLPEHDWRANIKNFKAHFAISKEVPEVLASLEDMVYGMALHGIKMRTIADMFNVKLDEFNAAFSDVWRSGNADLQPRA
jgi:hypothetical protein